ncbi:MAG: 16S rRNA (cytidine(1402)-2'-O)-methyltransferase [Deltaproteobacteria bacterium]|nr:16S rRNA (cytidine(1402)-2'-O)-methyltransferase [Deltaproteobacteria bacterium]
MTTGRLFVVATPIGNMEDMTLRALKVLKGVDLIAAEDTRVAKKLLGYYNISRPVESCFEHNEREKAPRLVAKMLEGANVALISDAGTPGISDPGYRLVRLAAENSIPIEPVPGPSALAAALSISGLPTDRFTFLGFAPSAAGQRKRFFLSLRGEPHTYVMYESPKRLKETLACALEFLGDIEASLVREMTKRFEEVLRGRLGSIIAALKDREVKGEITLILRTEEPAAGKAGLEAEIERLLAAGLALKDIAKAVALEHGISKSEAYKEALKVKGKKG